MIFSKNVSVSGLNIIIHSAILLFLWRRGRVARQRPAKPCTPVRIWSSPLKTLVSKQVFFVLMHPQKSDADEHHFDIANDIEASFNIRTVQRKILILTCCIFSISSRFSRRAHTPMRSYNCLVFR